MMNLARFANKYFNDSEPWKTVKSDKNQCATTLNICIQTIFTLAEVFSPLIPFTSEKIFKMLGKEPVAWDVAGKYNLQEGLQLNAPEILFRKIEDDVIAKQIDGMGPVTKSEPKVEPSFITLDEFKKVKLTAVKILEAKPVPKSEKLLQLKVSTGDETRQVLAGIAKSYSPEQLIGKTVLIVGNLQPAKLMGLESQGMILALDSEDGKVNIIELPSGIKPGTTAK
jgi:methionyl-tRNA synthetase